MGNVRQRGLTLMELLIGISVTAILVSVLMVAYTQSTRDYHHVESQQLVDRAVETALMEMETAAREAMYAEIVNNKLILTLPDIDSNEKAVPKKKKDRPAYDKGTSYAYYLSNSTGNPGQRGTYLWRGAVGSDGSIAPDMQLATPITRFVPSVIIESNGMYLVIDFESMMRTRDQTFRTVRQRTYLLLNSNTWR